MVAQLLNSVDAKKPSKKGEVAPDAAKSGAAKADAPVDAAAPAEPNEPK